MMTVLPKISIFNSLFKREKTRRTLYVDRKDVMVEFSNNRRRVIDDASLFEIIKPTPAIEKLLKTPHLVFFRQVATPLHETLEVIKLAKELELELCILEYGTDKLVTAHNFYKLGLGKLPIYKFTDKTGTDIYQKQTIIDFNKCAGKPLNEVRTLNGELLMDVHHDLFEYVTGFDTKSVTIDASDWFSQFNNSASEYYEAFFALFVKHNVLAEVFLQKQLDKDMFTDHIVWPAYNSVLNKFKHAPLIVNYQPPFEQARIYWDCYPSMTTDFLQKRGYIKN